MNPKERAARAALEYVRSGMTLGLGTGSTAQIFIDLLGAEVAAGRITNIRGIPTSVRSDAQARKLGIPVVDFATADHCDVTIDGADEVAPNLDVVKGLGGALLREKVVAQNSKQLIIIADESKRVAQLGTRSPLPVEVMKFSVEATERFLRTLGCDPVLRNGDDGKPYVTDNDNLIYDCHFKGITDPAKLNTQLKTRAGVIETGLFIGLATTVLIAGTDKVETLTRR
jgi:ribose 5-phosphate isomerase A